MARKGEDAYRNSELLSHREHREHAADGLRGDGSPRARPFLLAPERGGWRLMRPWLTAALDMRTRKFLGMGDCRNAIERLDCCRS